MSDIIKDCNNQVSSKRIAGLIGFALLFSAFLLEGFSEIKFNDIHFQTLAFACGGLLGIGVLEKKQ